MNVNADIKKQHFCVRAYLTKLCEEDPWKLDCNGFFQRICNSIANNGLESTCEFYNLEEKIIKLIKLDEDISKEIIQEILDWHTDCDYDECEIKNAIGRGASNSELIEIAQDIDPDLFDKFNKKIV